MKTAITLPDDGQKQKRAIILPDDGQKQKRAIILPDDGPLKSEPVFGLRHPDRGLCGR
jgi:hypothetical protein